MKGSYFLCYVRSNIFHQSSNEKCSMNGMYYCYYYNYYQSINANSSVLDNFCRTPLSDVNLLCWQRTDTTNVCWITPGTRFIYYFLIACIFFSFFISLSGGRGSWKLKRRQCRPTMNPSVHLNAARESFEWKVMRGLWKTSSGVFQRFCSEKTLSPGWILGTDSERTLRNRPGTTVTHGSFHGFQRYHEHLPSFPTKQLCAHCLSHYLQSGLNLTSREKR